MPARLRRLADRQHLLVAIFAASLILTSPWVTMLKRIPASAGFLDYAHVVLGFLCLGLAVTYLVTSLRVGGWRLYFPWAAADFGPLARDIGGLFRGRLPSAEGGGLFATIQGILMVLFLAAAATGAGWFFSQGSHASMAWRDWHIGIAWTFALALAVHLVTVSLHLLDFLGD
ncbi:MAG: cytochrome b/b6 domain-containing protein [Gammaproteobacteria bacterium]